MNHDISVAALIDAEDEEAIGLLGRQAEVQFARLAMAFNEQKAEIKMLKEKFKGSLPREKIV